MIKTKNHQFRNRDPKQYHLFLKNIWENAEGEYSQILGEQLIDWREIGQIRVIVAICRAFQDFSFVI